MKKWGAAALAAVFAFGAVAPALADRDDHHGNRNRGNHYGWSNRTNQCNPYNNRRQHRDDNDNDNDGDNRGGYNNGSYNNGSYNNGGYNNGGYNNGGYNNGGYNNGGYNNGGYNNGGYNNNCYSGGQYGQNSGNARIYGTIVSVDGNHVVLQSGGRRVDVNDQPALDNQSSGRVALGRTLTAYGYWQGNVFYATRMV